MFVPKPDDISAEDWSIILPINKVLESLIHMSESKSGQKLCAACARENESKNATSWCINCGESLYELCERYHRKSKSSYTHELVEITSQELSELALHYADMPCEEHSGKTVEAYCRNHSAVCCMTCVMLKHRNCKDVCSVEEAAEAKKTKIKESLEKMEKERVENLQSFNNDIQEITSEVNRLKSDMMSEISKIEQKVQSEIENEREELKSKISAIEYNLALFQTNMKYASSAQFLQTTEKIMEQKSTLEKFMMEKKKKLQDIRASMVVSEKLVEMQKLVQSFGKINIKRTRRLGQPKEDYFQRREERNSNAGEDFQRSVIRYSDVRIDKREPPSDYYLDHGNWVPTEGVRSLERRFRGGSQASHSEKG